MHLFDSPMLHDMSGMSSSPLGLLSGLEIPLAGRDMLTSPACSFPEGGTCPGNVAQDLLCSEAWLNPAVLNRFSAMLGFSMMRRYRTMTPESSFRCTKRLRADRYRNGWNKKEISPASTGW